MPATLIPFPVTPATTATLPLAQCRSRLLLQVGNRRFLFDRISTISELPARPAPLIFMGRAQRAVKPPGSR